MINRREDYKFTTPPEGIQIDGGIMPARDVADDGSWKVLRGEDPCFLAEAITRMLTFRRYGAYSPLSVERKVSGMQWTYIVEHLRDTSRYGDEFYVFDRHPATAGTYKMNVGGASADDYFGAILNSLSEGSYRHPEFFSDVYPNWGDKLEADKVRKVWYDYRQFGAIVSVGPYDMRVADGAKINQTIVEYSNGVIIDSRTSEIPEPVVGGGYTILSGGNRYAEVAGTGASASEYEWTLESILPRTQPTKLEDIFDMKPLVFLRISTRTADPQGGGLGEPSYDALVFEGVVDDSGKISLDGVTSSLILEMVRQARTIPSVSEMLSDSPPYGNAFYGCDISVQAVGIAFYDQSIDTSGIDWQWTPQS